MHLVPYKSPEPDGEDLDSEKKRRGINEHLMRTGGDIPRHEQRKEDKLLPQIK